MAFVAVLDQQRTDVLFEKGGVSCPWVLSCTENERCRAKDDGGHEQRQVMLSAAHGREWRGLRPAEVGLTSEGRIWANESPCVLADQSNTAGAPGVQMDDPSEVWISIAFKNDDAQTVVPPECINQGPF